VNNLLFQIQIHIKLLITHHEMPLPYTKAPAVDAYDDECIGSKNDIAHNVNMHALKNFVDPPNFVFVRCRRLL